jgi:hypothetical protein
MRKAGAILALGVALALGAFACAYLMGTSQTRAMMRQPQPELAWLQQEFGLNSEELKRISALHGSIATVCGALSHHRGAKPEIGAAHV